MPDVTKPRFALSQTTKTRHVRSPIDPTLGLCGKPVRREDVVGVQQMFKLCGTCDKKRQR